MQHSKETKCHDCHRVFCIYAARLAKETNKSARFTHGFFLLMNRRKVNRLRYVILDTYFLFLHIVKYILYIAVNCIFESMYIFKSSKDVGQHVIFFVRRK